MEPPVASLGKTVVGHHLLGGQFVHGQSRAQYSASHVGNVSHLKKALQGAVLTEGTVDEGEYGHRACSRNFGKAEERVPGGSVRVQPITERAVGQRRSRGISRHPPTVAGNTHRDDLVGIGVRSG